MPQKPLHTTIVSPEILSSAVRPVSFVFIGSASAITSNSSPAFISWSFLTVLNIAPFALFAERNPSFTPSYLTKKPLFITFSTRPRYILFTTLSAPTSSTQSSIASEPSYKTVAIHSLSQIGIFATISL